MMMPEREVIGEIGDMIAWRGLDIPAKRHIRRALRESGLRGRLTFVQMEEIATNALLSASVGAAETLEAMQGDDEQREYFRRIREGRDPLTGRAAEEERDG